MGKLHVCLFRFCPVFVDFWMEKLTFLLKSLTFWGYDGVRKIGGKVRSSLANVALETYRFALTITPLFPQSETHLYGCLPYM